MRFLAKKTINILYNYLLLIFIYYYSFDILTANLLKPHWGLTTTAFRAPLLLINGSSKMSVNMIDRLLIWVLALQFLSCSHPVIHVSRVCS